MGPCHGSFVVPRSGSMFFRVHEPGHQRSDHKEQVAKHIDEQEPGQLLGMYTFGDPLRIEMVHEFIIAEQVDDKIDGGQIEHDKDNGPDNPPFPFPFQDAIAHVPTLDGSVSGKGRMESVSCPATCSKIAGATSIALGMEISQSSSSIPFVPCTFVSG